MPAHLDVIQRLHSQHPPTSGNLESCLQFELLVLMELTLVFQFEQWGLLKAEGENVLPYHGINVKVGRICQPDGALAKLLTDIPTTNAPIWTAEDPIDPNRWVPFVVDGNPPPVDPPPLDLTPVLERLTRLEGLLITLEGMLHGDRETVREWGNRNEALYRDLAARTDELKTLIKAGRSGSVRVFSGGSLTITPQP